MGFSMQEYWKGLHFPSPGNLPNPGIEPRSPKLRVDSLPAELQRKPSQFKVIRTRWPSGQGDGVLIHCALHAWVRTPSSSACGFHALHSAWAWQVVVAVFNEGKPQNQKATFPASAGDEGSIRKILRRRAWQPTLAFLLL